MSLTEDQIKKQIDVLTTKTSDNPNMVFSKSAIRNTALDPEFFTGYNTKIVNAINMLAKEVSKLEDLVNSSSDKNDNILLDVHIEENKKIWNNVRELMEKDTLIEGIERILSGHQQHNILGLNADDIDKILKVSINDEGKPVIVAVTSAELNEIKAEDIKYNNENFQEFDTIGKAIDYILTRPAGGNNEFTGSISWEAIENKPDVPNELALSEGVLEMKSGDEVLSSIDITIDSDIDDILNDLE